MTMLLEPDELYPVGCFGDLDSWLRARVVQLSAAMLERPGASFNALFDRRRDRVGAYRMVENDDVSFQRLVLPAARSTGAWLAEHRTPLDPVLNLHDTTEFNLTHLAKMTGLGELTNPLCRGILLQNSLVVSPDQKAAVPLGVLFAHTWVRPPEEHGKAKRRKRLPFEQKESYRWWQAIEASEQRVGRPGVLVHVIDAEGDIYELLERCRRAGFRLLVRAAHDRRVKSPWASKLWEELERLPERGRRALPLQARPAREGRKARSARVATVSLRFGAVEVQAPGKSGEATKLWAILVQEEAPPRGEEAVEWLLLSLDPISTAEEAWERVGWYESRWLIEEQHKCLKSGMRAEARQFEAREHLENALALMLPVSARLLAMRNLSRAEPEEAAARVCSPDEVEVLRWKAKDLDAPGLGDRPTVGEVVTLIARLGGHMGRKGDGPPGWLTLWRGYERLQGLVQGYLLAKQHLRTAPSPPQPPTGRG